MEDNLIEKWRQGSYILYSSLPQNLQESLKDSIPCKDGKAKINNASLVVLVSQDCDIAANTQDEPWLQFVVADKVKKPHRLNFSVRSTRKLVLSSKYQDFQYELKIQKMCFLKKGVLLNPQIVASDIYTLTNVDVKLLKRWLTRRFNRTALPHEFNVRSKQLLENLENFPIDLYIRLNSYDEGLDSYSVSLVAVPYPFSQVEEVSHIQEALRKLAHHIDQTDGLQFDRDWLDANDATIYMERSEITLDLLDQLNLWNLDYISISHNDFDSKSD